MKKEYQELNTQILNFLDDKEEKSPQKGELTSANLQKLEDN